MQIAITWIIHDNKKTWCHRCTHTLRKLIFLGFVLAPLFNKLKLRAVERKWNKKKRKGKRRTEINPCLYLSMMNFFLNVISMEYDTWSNVKRVTSLHTTKHTLLNGDWHDQIWCGLDSISNAGFISKFSNGRL